VDSELCVIQIAGLCCSVDSELYVIQIAGQCCSVDSELYVMGYAVVWIVNCSCRNCSMHITAHHYTSLLCDIFIIFILTTKRMIFNTMY
jgi:hypothetical protein